MYVVVNEAIAVPDGQGIGYRVMPPEDARTFEKGAKAAECIAFLVHEHGHKPGITINVYRLVKVPAHEYRDAMMEVIEQLRAEDEFLGG